MLLSIQRLQSSVLLGLLFLIGTNSLDAACPYFANAVCVLRRD